MKQLQIRLAIRDSTLSFRILTNNSSRQYGCGYSTLISCGNLQSAYVGQDCQLCLDSICSLYIFFLTELALPCHRNLFFPNEQWKRFPCSICSTTYSHSSGLSRQKSTEHTQSIVVDAPSQYSSLLKRYFLL